MNDDDTRMRAVALRQSHEPAALEDVVRDVACFHPIEHRSGGAVRAVQVRVIIILRARRGPVAQLGARLNGIQKVRGSNPLGSTKLSSTS